uniref:Uncharacterized protein n=1 Tax=Parastrongyloides trichosuri TaxID=131310 RepID=A0A0N4ZVB9_PARTI
MSDSEGVTSNDEKCEFPEAPELRKNLIKLIENSIEFEKSNKKLKNFKTGNGFFLMSSSRKKFKLWLPPPIKQKKPDILKMRRKDLHLVENDSKVIKKQINESLLSYKDLQKMLQNN